MRGRPAPRNGRVPRAAHDSMPSSRPCSTNDTEGPDRFAIMVQAVWEIPKPLSVCDVRLDNHTVTTLRQHGNTSGTRLVLSHGSGLAIDLYYPFWSLLADDYELIVYDLRNHGWNSVGSAKDHNIPTLVHDHDIILDRIDRIYGNKPTVGVFHSLSTIIPLLSFTEPYSGLVLFDPPLCKPGASQVELHTAAEQAATRIRRRGQRFKTREDFAKLLGYTPAFARVAPGVLGLMAQTTLRPTASGEGYELRCPREYEAQLMDYARSFFPLVDLKLISCPAKIIGADPMLPYSYLPALDFSDMMEVDYDFIPEATHLLQIERPEECATAVCDFLNSHELV